LIAFCCDDGSVGIYNIKEKRIQSVFYEHTLKYTTTSVCFNNNDTQLSSGGIDGKVVVRFLTDSLKSYSFEEQSVSVLMWKF
jgi:WD40 repeat protein